MTDCAADTLWFGVTDEDSHFRVTERDSTVFADVDGGKDLVEALQRDHAVNHAGKGAVRSVHAPGEDNHPFFDDTAHQRFGYDQPCPGIGTQADEVLAVGNAFQFSSRHVLTVRDFTLRVGHPQAIEFRQACGLTV